ncbi:MAG: (2Fe-2S)-binding protein [Acidobacteria bacterium]|nr:(2Fe-2S)-binding protein [Acidobacteriota bacterium]
MTSLRINGIDIEAESGTTLLEAAQFLGIDIPTLCHHEGLSPYGGCRLCVVEVVEPGNRNTKMVSACTYPVQEGLNVRTHSRRVVRARKMLVELMLSVCPSSKTIQDLASKLDVQQMRFKVRHEQCILCGLCVRMCSEQMMAKAIGFVGRGYRRRVSTPFDMKSEVCRLCGGCMYICPACESRCQGPEALNPICGSCLAPAPTCLDVYDDFACFMGPAGDCGTCMRKAETRNQKPERVSGFGLRI